MSSERFAPPGYYWLCSCCGKKSYYDRYGIEGNHDYKWDESCSMNAVLVKYDDIGENKDD